MWFKRKTEVCHLLLANISTSLLDTPEEGSKISHHYSSRSYSKQQEMVKYSGNIMLLWRAKALKKNVPEVLSDTGKKTSACPGQKETKHSRWKVHLVIGFIILNTEREIQLFCWEKKKFSSYLSFVASGHNSEKIISSNNNKKVNPTGYLSDGSFWLTAT